MTRRVRLALGVSFIAAIGVAVAWVLVQNKLAAPQRTAPVVIFVVLDTLRADRTSLCGYDRPTTPNLERLVADGASHTCDSHSPGTWTLPSHATFFTGVGLEEHRAGDGGGPEPMSWGGVTPLGTELPTIAEEMSAKGYQTILLTGNPVIGERMGLTRGFEHRGIGRTYPMLRNGRLAARLRGLLRTAELDPSRPLFAFINIADAHSPWTAIPDWMGWVPERPALEANPSRRRFEAGEMDDAEAEAYLAHLSDVYDYGVYRADRSLGLVLDVLDEHGWLDQSYRLVITSDHGEYLGEHDMIEHGRAELYEPVTRVPLLYFSTDDAVELPSQVPTVVVHSLVENGALPTPTPPPVASAFRQFGPGEGELAPCASARAAFWDGPTKLVADRGRVQRYDLVDDPGEISPVAADDHPDAQRLIQHCGNLDDAYASRPQLDAEVDGAIRQQLKALGYLQGDSPPEAASP